MKQYIIRFDLPTGKAHNVAYEVCTMLTNLAAEIHEAETIENLFVIIDQDGEKCGEAKAL